VTSRAPGRQARWGVDAKYERGPVFKETDFRLAPSCAVRGDLAFRLGGGRTRNEY